MTRERRNAYGQNSGFSQRLNSLFCFCRLHLRLTQPMGDCVTTLGGVRRRLPVSTKIFQSYAFSYVFNQCVTFVQHFCYTLV